MSNGGNPDNPRVLLLIPTGVAAVKIDSITIHSNLTINCKGQFYSVNAKQKGSL